MEPLPAPRATRFLLLQNSELTCSYLAMLIAQTLDNGQYAHTVRDRLHFEQLQSPPDPGSSTIASFRPYNQKGQLLRSIGGSPVRGGQTPFFSSRAARHHSRSSSSSRGESMT
jgi:hypothetical protein